MKTVALEFVPPAIVDGVEKAREEVLKALDLARQAGVADQIGHLMIPGMIEEDPDRPVALKPRLDPLETWQAVRGVAPQLKGPLYSGHRIPRSDLARGASRSAP